MNVERQEYVNVEKSKKKKKIDVSVNVCFIFYLKFGKKNQIWIKRIDDFYVICFIFIVEVESKEGSRQGVQFLLVYILGMIDYLGFQNSFEFGVGRGGGQKFMVLMVSGNVYFNLQLEFRNIYLYILNIF